MFIMQNDFIGHHCSAMIRILVREVMLSMFEKLNFCNFMQ